VIPINPYYFEYVVMVEKTKDPTFLEDFKLINRQLLKVIRQVRKSFGVSGVGPIDFVRMVKRPFFNQNIPPSVRGHGMKSFKKSAKFLLTLELFYCKFLF